jgi:hypothetical protein
MQYKLLVAHLKNKPETDCFIEAEQKASFNNSSIEKLNSGWTCSQAEVNLAKSARK